ncbi:MAG: hypothetical protein ACYDFT_08190, partial [Thermoplasmata archaeon]
MKCWIELSGENTTLALAECSGAVRSLGGEISGADSDLPVGPFVGADLPDLKAAHELARRIALAHRVLTPWPERGLEEIRARVETEARLHAEPLSMEWLARPSGELVALRDALAQAHIGSGGVIRPRTATRRYYLLGTDAASLRLSELVQSVDRTQYGQRRMPALPFQRPVSLPPRKARAAANLAGIGPGCRVADPFVGTGALLLEAGLLGGRLFGSDRDPDMIRGALRNLAAFGLHAEGLTIEDAAEAVHALPWAEIDILLTDPPYGRASSTGGEGSTDLIGRVLPIWAERVASGGRIVLIGPSGPDP